MARDPGSAWAPLAEAGAPDGYEKTQFIVHSTGDNGTAAATYRYFSGPTPNESTFIVGWGPHDPTQQLMDSTDRADANLSASIRAISVEVVGDGISGYNAWQRSELIRLALWARKVHPGILPRVIPSHTEPGFGWHVMFGAPGPWAGVAKSCPGKQRIKELQTDIFPAIFAGADTSVEDDMLPEEKKQLAEVHWMLSQIKPQTDRVEDEDAQTDLLMWAIADPEQGLRTQVASLQGQVAALASALTAIPGGSGLDMAAVKTVADQAASKAATEALAGLADRLKPSA